MIDIFLKFLNEHPIYSLIGFVFFLFYLMYSTWVDYVALTNIRKNKEVFDNTTGLSKVFGNILYAKGLFKDFLVRVFVGTIVFYEIKFKDVLFTFQCERHLDGPEGLRKHRAKWFCWNFLDPYDVNKKHCREKK